MTPHLKASYCLLLFLFAGTFVYCQQLPQSRHRSLMTRSNNDIFGSNAVYIENIGQYGDTLKSYGAMGRIICAYEGLPMPVLFTAKGIIHLQRQVHTPDRAAIEKEEARKKKKTEGREEWKYTDKIITMEWVNADPDAEIILVEVSPSGHSYGMFTKKARGYKKLIYKNIYPGIDVEYSFLPGSTAGFEYKLMVKPGADISRVKMKYGGDLLKIEKTSDDNLVIRSSIEGITQSAPIAFEGAMGGKEIGVSFILEKQYISFKLPAQYNRELPLVIDPFVSSTLTLTGQNNGKAKDIDFDYSGNIYASGGGDQSSQKLVKFDPAGNLLWTFNGTLSVPSWTFGQAYGGWVVEKISGSVYLGQGLAGSGFSVIRLNTNGVYDNYITTPNSSFGENWKMLYSCRGGLGTMLIAGGGGSANNELALLAPPSVIPGISNISGLTGGHNDISDIIMDPLTDEMYTIFSTSVLTPSADNIIYKHVPPYNALSRAWSVGTGLFALREPNNRPYISGLDNSSNTIALNATYLFYWDGQTLKAFNKNTGATVGTPLIVTGNAKLQQGGIFADDCNNVFVGEGFGIIKVYKFTTTAFVDSLAADITIANFQNAVYDLAYDNGRKLLYASGNGFVTSVDVSGYCPSTLYTVNVAVNCPALSAIATLSPAPPASSSIDYELYAGSVLIASNTTGIFTGLVPGDYTVKVYVNKVCGGPQSSRDFSLTTSPVIVINDPPPACLPFTTDLTASAITAGSSPGLSFTYWLDAAATNSLATPASASAGTYYIKGTAASGCFNTGTVNVMSLPEPIANAGIDTTICFGTDVRLSGSGGISYVWSPSAYLDDPLIANPTVRNAPTGVHVYHLTITDANGCRSQVNEEVRVTVSISPNLYIASDTMVAYNQPLQLNAIDINNIGFINYLWSPVQGLNDPRIKNPVAILDRDMTYIVRANTASNCVGMALIHVKVYKGPEIYVPSAFTPVRNGLNDVLKAIPVGIREFKYFRVYNRLGQLVFSTSDWRKGWDGTIQGLDQNPGVFVWVAEAVDYKGNVIFRKGTSTLIR